MGTEIIQEFQCSIVCTAGTHFIWRALPWFDSKLIVIAQYYAVFSLLSFLNVNQSSDIISGAVNMVNYKNCYGPECRNISFSTSDKVFILLPANMKQKKFGLNRRQGIFKRFLLTYKYVFKEIKCNITVLLNLLFSGRYIAQLKIELPFLLNFQNKFNRELSKLSPDSEFVQNLDPHLKLIYIV